MEHKFRMKYLEQIIRRYHESDKIGKRLILDEGVKTCGYNRKYLIYLLNRGITLEQGKGIIKGRGRRKLYSGYIEKLIEDIWQRAQYPWSVRLKEILKDWMPWIKREYGISARHEKMLLKISSASIDRILKKRKRLIKKRIYGRTKPGSLLKRNIAVMTGFHDINEAGHLEIDLVSHSGPNASGEFIYTLNTVDIYSGWDESIAVLGKGEKGVLKALREIIISLPFKVKSIDSDNGSEFINWHLYRWSKDSGIYLTRSRENKKDDNAHIEQKNWTHARKLLGWDRYEGEESLRLINDFYRNEHRLFMNLFQPSVKLIKRERIGTKIKKIYDKPKTPFERLREKYPNSEKIKELEEMREKLNPFQLAQIIEKKLELIWKTANRTKKATTKARSKELRQEEILEEVKKLMKKEAVHG